MRNIGDKVFIAKTNYYQESIVCLDCFGKKYVTVIMGDDSKVTIPCQGCASGYEEPTGYMKHYQYSESVEELTITGLEIKSNGKIEYRVAHYIYEEENVFDTKEQAEKKAVELAEQRNIGEQESIKNKQKVHKNWSWNASYWRGEIRDAERRIKHATERLNWAKTKMGQREGK